jgi:crossover junction endodeoxyribonuclease RuvC
MPEQITGLDLSLTSTGFAEIRHACACGTEVKLATITPGKRTGHERLEYLFDEICNRAFAADLVVIEGPSYGSDYGKAHERAGLWWLIAHCLWRTSTPYAVVTPSQVKKYATGAGAGPKSGKDKVLAAVIRRYADVPVDGNDQADALVLAAMAADHYGDPLAQVPAGHKAALAAVNWPAL